MKLINFQLNLSIPTFPSLIRIMCGQRCSVLAKNGFVTPRITAGGAGASAVYSLNSESCIVKYGR